MADEIGDTDFRALAQFRYGLRRFLQFSEDAARGAGLTPQHHQAMLAIRSGGAEGMLVGELAERLLLRPHSTSGLVDRMEKLGLVARAPAEGDKRQVQVRLTTDGEALLQSLSAAHRSELRRIRPLLVHLIESL